MITELLTQLFFAASIARMLPVDAATLEWQVGAAPEPYAFLPESADVFGTLPRAADRPVAPKKVDAASYGIVTSARSAIVVDAASGAVLFSKRPDEQRAIGSITKLMAVYTFLQSNPELDSKVTLFLDDYVAGGRTYLRFDDPVYVYDVLKASLIGSDNTATAALARLSGMSEEVFVARMNEHAALLGMMQTKFADASGVDARNMATARDLTLLLAAVESNETMANIMAMDDVTITQASGYHVTVESTNLLLDSYLHQGAYHVVAGKTGFIPQAGYCLATAIEENGNRVRVVVLGAESKDARFRDAKGLAAWAFATFSWE